MRFCSEHLFPLRFPDLIPPTVVTADPRAIRSFLADQGTAVVKPVDGFAGRGVPRLDRHDPQPRLAHRVSLTDLVNAMEPVVASPGKGCDDGAVDDWVTVAPGLLAGHPAVESVEFAGSRSRGTHEELSDWDFAVETSDFEALARDMPALVAPLNPLGQQWEPMGHFPVYQVFLRGPTKIEYLFLEQSQEPTPPLEPGRDTLPAINTHFWDWIWWLTTKASIGRGDLVGEHMAQLHTQLLRPMGVSAVPASIRSAVEVFVARRDALEAEFGVSVDRALENEVRNGMDRVLPAGSE